MDFKRWIAESTNDFSRWKDIILGYLNLDPTHGLSQPLETMNRENLKTKLQGLGEFTKLPSPTQQQVLGFIDSQQGGTVGELIRQIAGEPRI